MEFEKKVIKIGRIGILTFGALSFLPALALWLVFGVIPPVNVILSGWVNIAAIYALFYVIEPIQYYPIMGLSGVYMGFMAGNIPTRLPAMISAQKVLEVEQGTEKGDIVATIAIAGTVVMTIGTLLIAAFAGQVVLKVLPAQVVSAFDFAIPAIIGVVLANYLSKQPILTLMIGAIGYIAVISPFPAFIKTPVCIILGIVVAVLWYTRQKKRSVKNA